MRQALHDDFIENTISNYYLPLVLHQILTSMERSSQFLWPLKKSSVVAAVHKAAKYWGARGGFKTEILEKRKLGKFILFIRAMEKSFSPI